MFVAQMLVISGFVLYVGNTDYVSIAASLQRLTPEGSSTVISIVIVNDNITEGEENFTIALSSTSPEVGVSSSAVITILDDDNQGISSVPPRAYPATFKSLVV